MGTKLVAFSAICLVPFILFGGWTNDYDSCDLRFHVFCIYILGLLCSRKMG